MPAKRVSVRLRDLIENEVYPADLIVENARFKADQEVNEVNPPFYRLSDLVNLRKQGDFDEIEVMATPVDDKLWPFIDGFNAEEDIEAMGKMGVPIAQLADPTGMVTDLDDPKQVTFVDRPAYDRRISKIENAKATQDMSEPAGESPSASPTM